MHEKILFEGASSCYRLRNILLFIIDELDY